MWVGIEMLGQAALHGNNASQPVMDAQAAKEKTTTTTKCQHLFSLPSPDPPTPSVLWWWCFCFCFAFCVYAGLCIAAQAVFTVSEGLDECLVPRAIHVVIPFNTL